MRGLSFTEEKFCDILSRFYFSEETQKLIDAKINPLKVVTFPGTLLYFQKTSILTCHNLDRSVRQLSKPSSIDWVLVRGSVKKTHLSDCHLMQ